MPSTEEELRKALKAFKKRLKLTQLEEDSKLGHSPLTGSRSQILSIQPPKGFGREVWEELADKGFLKFEDFGSSLVRRPAGRAAWRQAGSRCLQIAGAGGTGPCLREDSTPIGCPSLFTRPVRYIG